MNFVLISLFLSILTNILQTLVIFLRFVKAIKEQKCKECKKREYADLNVQMHDESLMF